MLTPDYLEHAPDGLAQLMRQLEEDILRDVARRVGRMGGVTETARWQLWRLDQLQGLREDVVRLLAQYSGKTDGEIRHILSESGTAALETDDELYRAAGLSPAPVNESPALVNLLNAGYRQTRGTWQNLTATTANTVTGQFEAALDRAWLQVSSGAFDCRTAIRRAVGDLARHMTYVTYPSGHRDTLEVAARRAVLTGVNQTALRLQDARMEEMGCEFVETTAHHGARPEHALWQGKVFHVGGAVTCQGVFYPDFKTATRYGEGDGLGGWNCRHNKFPFFPGLSERACTDEKLTQLNARDIEYNGKKYTRYEISQMQRAAERRVRAAKKRYLAEDAAGLDVSEAALDLKAARTKLLQFTRATGLNLDSARISTYGFGHSAASKTSWIVRKDLQNVLETARSGSTIVLSHTQEDALAQLPFEQMQPLVGKLSNRATRKWYLYQDGLIPEQIDRSLPLEVQARMACELRNRNRTQARDLMRDQAARRILDTRDPNVTFEQLLERKMNRGMTRDEALADIIRSATKTRQSVNQSLGLE